MKIEMIVQGERIGWLTTESPLSSHGLPVFRADHDPGRYGPTDFGPQDKLPMDITAAAVVKDWAEHEAGVEGRDAAAAFLSQRPEGPQL